MKIRDLYNEPPGNGRSPLGGDYGIYVNRSSSNSEACSFTAIKSDTGDELGTSTVEKSVITQMDTSVSDKKTASLVSSKLIREMCKYADENNLILVIDSLSIDDSDKTFINRFGFLTTNNAWLERKPGAMLPYSVLENSS